MSDDEPKDESTDDSEQQTEEQPAESDQPAEQSENQSTESDQPADQTEEQAADDQSADQVEEQPTDTDQPAEPSEEQPADSEQSSEQSEEPSADSDQPSNQAEELPADSDQSEASASADNTLAFAGGAASAASGGLGVQARPGPQPKRAPRAPVKHDFAVRFTFLTSLRGFLAKGFYRFEISAEGTMLATRAWSSVSVTVPDFFNFSLSQITRSGEKSPSFDFHVDLSWLPFSTTYQGTPANPNDPAYANMIEKDSRIVTTLRPKDNSSSYLTIPPLKGTAVTKIDLHSEIGIVDTAVRAPSANENDFITALFNSDVDPDQLVEKGPPVQSTKDGVTTFLFEVKFYRSATIKGATVLP